MGAQEFSQNEFVSNDEKYFTLSGSQVPGNNGYYTSNPSSSSATVKCIN